MSLLYWGIKITVQKFRAFKYNTCPLGYNKRTLFSGHFRIIITMAGAAIYARGQSCFVV